MSKTYTVEFSFGQILSLVETLKAVHADSNYYMERVLSETPEELARNSYVFNDAERNVEKRAQVAALVAAITGEPFGDSTEGAQLKAKRPALDLALEAKRAADAEAKAAEEALNSAF